MADKLASIFGKYADPANLQYLIDKALEGKTPLWFEQYFDWSTPSISLSYDTIVGKNRIEAMASVVNRGAKAPLRGRGGLERFSGKVPAIMEKFHLDEQTLREHLLMRRMAGAEDAVASQIIDLITDDVTKAGGSTMRRLNAISAQAISTGKIWLDTTNNPDGVALEPLDLLMPSTSKVNAAVSWTGNPATATPITDFQGIYNNARPRGVILAKALMTWNSWNAFIQTTQVKEMVATFLGRKDSKIIPVMDDVNNFLRNLQLPVIELVDIVEGVEKDGKISSHNPFEDTNVSFVPGGKLGKIHHAFAIEELEKVNQVSYAKYNRTLISKWGENDPFQEYTKAELNAMPGLEAIDGMYLLSRTAAF